MKIIGKLATIFLLLVGVEYIIIGLLTIAGLGVLSGALATLGYIIAPQQLLHLALDSGSGEWFKVNRSIELTLGLFSIFGGIAGLLGAIKILHNRTIGYKIWLALVSMSVIVVLWNFIYFFTEKTIADKAFAFGLLSSRLAFIYVLSLFVVWKASYKDAI